MTTIASQRLSDFNERIKVLFIAGPTRSGSTILSNILGQIDGFFHAGEVIEAWDRGQKWKCSCGRRPGECVVWADIFRTLNATISERHQASIIHMRDRTARSHKVLLEQFRKNGNGLPDKKEKTYLDGLTILYKIIEQKTGAHIIIDSSKNIGYCNSLNKTEAIDLYVVHLIRDARATAFSWSRKKKELWRSNPLLTSFQWTSRNIAAEYLSINKPKRFMRLRYEDFMSEPLTSLQRILNMLHVAEAKLPFIAANEVLLKTSHGLCGNPVRFNRGREKLVSDNHWRKMNRIDRIMSTLVSWPLLLRYRYPINNNSTVTY